MIENDTVIKKIMLYMYYMVIGTEHYEQTNDLLADELIQPSRLRIVMTAVQRCETAWHENAEDSVVASNNYKVLNHGMRLLATLVLRLKKNAGSDSLHKAWAEVFDLAVRVIEYNVKPILEAKAIYEEEVESDDESEVDEEEVEADNLRNRRNYEVDRDGY